MDFETIAEVVLVKTVAMALVILEQIVEVVLVKVVEIVIVAVARPMVVKMMYRRAENPWYYCYHSEQFLVGKKIQMEENHYYCYHSEQFLVVIKIKMLVRLAFYYFPCIPLG